MCILNVMTMLNIHALNDDKLELTMALAPVFNTLASGWFWRFSQKEQQFSVALPTP